MYRFLMLSVWMVALLGLGGCADTPHQCPLEKGPGCESTTQVYNDARRADPEAGGQWVPHGSDVPAAGPDWGGASAYAEPGQVGEPIFREPRVYRVWVAPFTDADGLLHSGQYVYFSTPGQWRYGELHAPGAATPGLYGPLPPASPSEDKGKVTTLTVPSGKPPAPSTAQKDTTVNGITQPKETLTP